MEYLRYLKYSMVSVILEILWMHQIEFFTMYWARNFEISDDCQETNWSSRLRLYLWVSINLFKTIFYIVCQQILNYLAIIIQIGKYIILILQNITFGSDVYSIEWEEK